MPNQYSNVPKIPRTCPACSRQFFASQKRLDAGRGIFCSWPCARRGVHLPAPERFWTKVDKSAGPLACWLWLAALWGSTRYGKFGPSHGETVLAHRYSWELANGPIPAGMKVLHKCDNPQCVNPAHLFLGTNADNTADMIRKGRNSHGETHHAAKLSRTEVSTMRELFETGAHSQKALAARFGISVATANKILRRKAWTQV